MLISFLIYLSINKLILFFVLNSSKFCLIFFLKKEVNKFGSLKSLHIGLDFSEKQIQFSKSFQKVFKNNEQEINIGFLF